MDYFLYLEKMGFPCFTRKTKNLERVTVVVVGEKRNLREEKFFSLYFFIVCEERKRESYTKEGGRGGRSGLHLGVIGGVSPIGRWLGRNAAGLVPS